MCICRTAVHNLVSYILQSAIPSHPLNFSGLSTFCNEQNSIAEEFAGIPQVTARIDELPPGAEVKNRYANVVPLPETRVSLMKINNDPLTEYINASYVRVSFANELNPWHKVCCRMQCKLWPQQLLNELWLPSNVVGLQYFFK